MLLAYDLQIAVACVNDSLLSVDFFVGFLQLLQDLQHVRIQHITPQHKVVRNLNGWYPESEVVQFQSFSRRSSLAAGDMFWYASGKHNSRELLKALPKQMQVTEVKLNLFKIVCMQADAWVQTRACLNRNYILW